MGNDHEADLEPPVGCMGGCLSWVGLTAVFVVGAMIGVARLADRPHTPRQPTLVPQTIAPVPVAPTSPSDHSGVWKVGQEVEVIVCTLAADLSIHEEHLSASRMFKRDQEIFRVSPSTHARIQAAEGDALQIEVLQGPWKGRSGWVAWDWVRRVPSEEELAGDVVDGLTLGQRREIYLEFDRAASDAWQEAEKLYPYSPPNKRVNQAAWNAERKKHTDAIFKRHRESVLRKYGIDNATLDRIIREGVKEMWPSD